MSGHLFTISWGSFECLRDRNVCSVIFLALLRYKGKIMNVVVDIANPNNRNIAHQLGVSGERKELPRVRGLELQNTTNDPSNTTFAESMLPEGTFQFTESESFVRFGAQLIDLLKAPRVTVRTWGMYGNSIRQYSAAKVKLSTTPSTDQLRVGAHVLATHPMYEEWRWWAAKVAAKDEKNESNSSDDGVFLHYDDGDTAYQKLSQVRIAQPLSEGHDAADEITELETGVEVLVAVRQYTHGEGKQKGTFHEFTLGQVVAMDDAAESGGSSTD